MPVKVGQETGQVRSTLPLDKLLPYLEGNIDGFKGPVDVKQFKVGRDLSELTGSLVK